MPPIFVADQLVPDPVSTVEEYLRKHRKTARVFDLPSGNYEEISEALIIATRVFSSRISNAEATWFVELGATAPWEMVKPGDRLADADPTLSGRLYDGGEALWSHFADERRRGVAAAKISKVLHAMRPHFFPVLDSRVRRTYRSAARSAAGELQGTRSSTHAYWAAIRIDITRSSDGLRVTREQLLESDNELVRAWAGRVSDVRLHDVVAWGP